MSSFIWLSKTWASQNTSGSSPGNNTSGGISVYDGDSLVRDEATGIKFYDFDRIMATGSTVEVYPVLPRTLTSAVYTSSSNGSTIPKNTVALLVTETNGSYTLNLPSDSELRDGDRVILYDVYHSAGKPNAGVTVNSVLPIHLPSSSVRKTNSLVIDIDGAMVDLVYVGALVENEFPGWIVLRDV